MPEKNLVHWIPHLADQEDRPYLPGGAADERGPLVDMVGFGEGLNEKNPFFILAPFLFFFRQKAYVRSFRSDLVHRARVP